MEFNVEIELIRADFRKLGQQSQIDTLDFFKKLKSLDNLPMFKDIIWVRGNSVFNARTRSIVILPQTYVGIYKSIAVFYVPPNANHSGLIYHVLPETEVPRF